MMQGYPIFDGWDAPATCRKGKDNTMTEEQLKAMRSVVAKAAAKHATEAEGALAANATDDARVYITSTILLNVFRDALDAAIDQAPRMGVGV